MMPLNHALEGLPVKKLQITMDEETVELLETLAAPRAGNKSYVVREAVRRMAEQEGFETYLDWLESQPKVRASLDRASADEREGRTVAHADVIGRYRPGKK